MRFLLFFLVFNISNFISAQISNNDENIYDSLFVKWNDTFLTPKNTALNLVCPKIDTVRIAIIGLGNRGMMAIERLPQIPTIKIVAIADIDSNKAVE